MKQFMITSIIRMGLTIVLLVFAYRETGWATCLILSLVCLDREAHIQKAQLREAKLKMLKGLGR